MIMHRPARQIVSAARGASLGDLRVVAGTLVLAPLVEIGLRTVGVRRTAGMLKIRLVFEGLPRTTKPGRTEPQLLPRERRRLTVAWRILELGPFDSTCLRRAIVGARLLRTRNHAVRIGVRTTSEGFKAHAWLEIDGISLDPDASGQFSASWQQASDRE